MEIKDLDGVIVSDVLKSGASDKADIQKGDVVRKVNSLQINNKANLEELIANSYPGDEVDLLVERNGKITTKKLVLTNREGTVGIIKRNIFTSDKLEVTLERVSKVERDALGISSGVKIIDYKKNGFGRMWYTT